VQFGIYEIAPIELAPALRTRALQRPRVKLAALALRAQALFEA
jgi:hypothetical protein